MEEGIGITTEQVTAVRVNGELIAIVSHNLKKRVQTFSTCTDMGDDEIKALLEKLSRSETTI